MRSHVSLTQGENGTIMTFGNREFGNEEPHRLVKQVIECLIIMQCIMMEGHELTDVGDRCEVEGVAMDAVTRSAYSSSLY